MSACRDNARDTRFLRNGLPPRHAPTGVMSNRHGGLPSTAANRSNPAARSILDLPVLLKQDSAALHDPVAAPNCPALRQQVSNGIRSDRAPVVAGILHCYAALH